jgi:hypothetical protein
MPNAEPFAGAGTGVRIERIRCRGPFFTKFANSRRNQDLVIRALQRFQEFKCGIRIATEQDVGINCREKENNMSTTMNVARQVIHDKLEAHISAAEAKLQTLKAEAETAKADIEVKAITELLTKQHEIVQKLRELRK